jgi:hypothetical protein
MGIAMSNLNDEAKDQLQSKVHRHSSAARVAKDVSVSGDDQPKETDVPEDTRQGTHTSGTHDAPYQGTAVCASGWGTAIESILEHPTRLSALYLGRSQLQERGIAIESRLEHPIAHIDAAHTHWSYRQLYTTREEGR